MVSDFFIYNKAKVIQALRYHFISRMEIKVMMILVNVYAITTAALFFFKQISPLAFLISSLLWFVLMIIFWFVLPNVIYKKAVTFKDRFQAILTEEEFRIENERGGEELAMDKLQYLDGEPAFLSSLFQQPFLFYCTKGRFSRR